MEYTRVPGQWSAEVEKLRSVFVFHSQSACFYCPREGCEGGGEGSRYIRLHVAGATESAIIRYLVEEEGVGGGRREEEEEGGGGGREEEGGGGGREEEGGGRRRVEGGRGGRGEGKEEERWVC